jgi:rhodanese-related sulfurtransferase
MITLSPQEAAERVKNGAVLIDIRETGERRRAHIAGSAHHPLSQLDSASGHAAASEPIYYCASGNRTRASARKLETSGAPAAMLAGGLQGWRQAGFLVIEDRSAPIDIMRQVMIAAGSLVLLGVGLGFSVNPAFYGLSAFVGAGLVFAGVTGICAMARLLSLAPWNR